MKVCQRRRTAALTPRLAGLVADEVKEHASVKKDRHHALASTLPGRAPGQAFDLMCCIGAQADVLSVQAGFSFPSLLLSGEQEEENYRPMAKAHLQVLLAGCRGLPYQSLL